MLEYDKIYCGDALTKMREIDDCSVDAVIVDPPYFIENLKKNIKGQGIRGKKIDRFGKITYRQSPNTIFFSEWDHFESLDAFKRFIKDILLEFRRVLKPKGQVYMFMSYHHIDWLIQIIKELDFRFYKPLIWYKPDIMGLFPNQYGCNYESILWFRKSGDMGGVFKNHIGCSQKDVFTFNSANSVDRKDSGGHPTPKPVALIRQLIKNCTDEGDVVLDCFLGSGTTAVASQQCGRHFIGIDVSQEYCNIAENRLRQEVLVEWFK